MKNSKKLLSVLLTFIMTFSLMIGGLTTAFAATTGVATTTTITANPTSIVANGVSTSTITVQVKDSTGANVTLGGDIVALSASVGTIGTVTDNVNGTYTATYTSATTAGTVTISGTLNGTAITSTATINLTAGAATNFNVVPAATTITAGTAQNYVVTALDQYGNTANGYSGMVEITSNDAQAVLPANSALTSGVGTFSVTLKTASANTVTATDTVTTTITGTSSAVTVNADVVASITITPATATVAASGTQPFTAQGFDQYNNPATFTNLTWSVSGPAATAGLSIDTTGALAASATPTDGNYLSSVIATDGTIIGTSDVTVDTIPPTVTGVIDGGFYKTVSPTFTEGTATLTTGVGTPGAYTTNTPIAGDSAQVLVVTDAAGNVTKVNFTTDNTAPTAPTVDITEGALYDANGVTPTISIAPADANQTVTLDNSAYTNVAITTDGAHVLVITNTDAAGNTSSITVNFTVDAVVPVVTISGIMEGQITNQTVTPNATGGDTYAVTLTNNGTLVTGYALGTAITAEGSYALSVTPTDAAGNTGSATVVNFTIDTTAPTAPTVDLVGDSDTVVTGFAEPGSTVMLFSYYTFIAVDADAITGAYNITIPVQVAGTSLSVYVKDAANNASLDTVAIVTDTTLPVITLTGNASENVAIGAAYADDGATASDNVDGDITASIATTITNDVNAETTFDSSVAATYTYHYNVSDAAGNAAIEVTRTVNVTAPVTSITGNNILLVGDYAFDLSDPANNKYNSNNFLVAANTAYLNAGTYEVYFRIGDQWYDIVSDPTMAAPILDLSTINGTGLFNYMNMQ